MEKIDYTKQFSQNELGKICEAMSVVSKFNDRYYHKTQDDTRLPFEFVYCDMWMGIKYNDEIVWDNQDYDVNSYEIDDEEFQDTIEECVINRVIEIQNIFAKFKI